MKLLEVTRLESTNRYNIILVKYSEPSLLWGVTKERKAYKEVKGVYWYWLDTDRPIVQITDSIDAIMSTELTNYKI